MSDVTTWLEEYEIQQRAQDRRPIAEKADPLALSWVAYHVWTKFPQKRWAPWRDLEVHEHDRAMADETRRYYRNRLAMQALKSNQEPTQFSRDLYDVCNGGIMRECHRGMLYRLPYFYVEDTGREALIEATKAQPDLQGLPISLVEISTRELRRHSRIFHSRRSRERMEYWFHDLETGYAVMWPVDYQNPLRSVIESWWNSHRPALVTARWCLGHDRLRGFHYWVVSEPELVLG